jgi:hypothetical protein
MNPAGFHGHSIRQGWLFRPVGCSGRTNLNFIWHNLLNPARACAQVMSSAASGLEQRVNILSHGFIHLINGGHGCLKLSPGNFCVVQSAVKVI